MVIGMAVMSVAVRMEEKHSQTKKFSITCMVSLSSMNMCSCGL